jgi:hypothetical protein
MATQNETVALVEGFAKANPETIERLNAAAREMLNPCRQELTAKELEAAQVAFCLGGVWVIINQVNINPK